MGIVILNVLLTILLIGAVGNAVKENADSAIDKRNRQNYSVDPNKVCEAIDEGQNKILGRFIYSVKEKFKGIICQQWKEGWS